MNEFINTTQQTVQWFKQRSDHDELEMSPPFQRNPVWVLPQKSFLIDTILQGLPIPEIYLQETITDDGKSSHTIVDGQQRIRACLEFLEGGFEIQGNDSPKWADMSYDDLSPADKKKILGYKFVVRTLPEMSEEQTRAIFARLNRNTVALNQQELRHAIYWGEFITTVDRISDLDFWVASNLFTPNDFRRMLDREYVSELAIGIVHGIQNKKVTLDKWYEAYEVEFPHRRKVEDVFEKVTGELLQTIPELSKTRWSKKSDFYTLFLVLANKVNEFPLTLEGRNQLRTNLLSFGEKVDEFTALSIEDDGGSLSENAVSDADILTDAALKYASAVQRAASDLASRRVRHEQLDSVLSALWSESNEQKFGNQTS